MELTRHTRPLGPDQQQDREAAAARNAPGGQVRDPEAADQLVAARLRGAPERLGRDQVAVPDEPRLLAWALGNARRLLRTRLEAAMHDEARNPGDRSSEPDRRPRDPGHATPPNPRQAAEARRLEIDNLVRAIAEHQETARAQERQGRDDLAAEARERADRDRALLRHAQSELARDLDAADDVDGGG